MTLWCVLVQSWDRSHFFENLSGYETHCTMNGRKSWPFANARRIATEMGHRFFIRRKDTPNRGNTTDALRVILQSFKELTCAKKIGCSVIPDCMRPRRGGTTEMYVVVSCVYEKK
ncbi:hypothetical protein LSAT2_012704 [Lamellibrachia satsuma]|nr:hypothetical protein LSAT2_012704 [Lamellibrachia satsuma]